MHCPTRLAPTVAIVLSCAALAGCEDKITKSNFDKVEVGMSLSRVEKILGSGREDAAAAGVDISGGGIATQNAAAEKVYVWESDSAKIVIIFKDNAVVQKRQQGLDN